MKRPRKNMGKNRKSTRKNRESMGEKRKNTRKNKKSLRKNKKSPKNRKSTLENVKNMEKNPRKNPWKCLHNYLFLLRVKSHGGLLPIRDLLPAQRVSRRRQD